MLTRSIAPLHEGHAPALLHLAFNEALDEYESWQAGTPEPVVEFEGRRVPIGSIFGRMRNCTDLLPVRIVRDVEHVTGAPLAGSDGEAPTYASAAFVLRALVIERLKATAA